MMEKLVACDQCGSASVVKVGDNGIAHYKAVSMHPMWVKLNDLVWQLQVANNTAQKLLEVIEAHDKGKK